jgi:hypothetical protein
MRLKAPLKLLLLPNRHLTAQPKPLRTLKPLLKKQPMQRSKLSKLLTKLPKLTKPNLRLVKQRLPSSPLLSKALMI